MAGALRAAPRAWRPNPRLLSGAIVLLVRCGVAPAANLVPSGNLGTQLHELPFPGLGRIIAAFLLTAGLAVAAAVALRRFRPALFNRRGPASGIRLLDRSALSTTLTVSVVEVDGARYLVAEGRAGVGLAPVATGSPSRAEHST